MRYCAYSTRFTHLYKGRKTTFYTNNFSFVIALSKLTVIWFWRYIWWRQLRVTEKCVLEADWLKWREVIRGVPVLPCPSSPRPPLFRNNVWWAYYSLCDDRKLNLCVLPFLTRCKWKFPENRFEKPRKYIIEMSSNNVKKGALTSGFFLLSLVWGGCRSQPGRAADCWKNTRGSRLMFGRRHRTV